MQKIGALDVTIYEIEKSKMEHSFIALDVIIQTASEELEKYVHLVSYGDTARRRYQLLLQ